MSISISLEGIPELEDKLNEIENTLGPDVIEPILLRGAETMADAIRQRAPRGPTGNLRRSVVAKKLARRGKSAAAIAAIDFRIAPHAPFVEKGTRYMTARPFFALTAKANESRVSDQIRDDIDNALQGACA
jgi:HK97 gp10 family phage protein